MINIASLILTRRCNLNCEYCRISGDANYIIAPSEYPNASYYYENEKNSEFWIDSISRLVKHNKDMFFILFGGEPFMYDGLSEIVKEMNFMGCHYTIISNCTMPEEIKNFFDCVGSVMGFTASIDPGFWLGENDNHEKLKSIMGFEMLKYLIRENAVADPVAEVVVDNENIVYLEETVKRLSDAGITSSISTLDIAKNNYYDFSSITSTDQLVTKSEYTKKVFDNLINGNYKIHMKEILLPKIYDILPAELDCKIEDNLHNITMDSDGVLRTCLRIRGREIPKVKIYELLDENGNWYQEILEAVMQMYKQDKQTLCLKCNYVCQLMSLMGDSERIKYH